MKVKNLLLAGLAVAAMTACSNDEIVDSSAIATGEDASIRISFLAPASGTRSVTSGGTDAGSKLVFITIEQPKLIRNIRV